MSWLDDLMGRTPLQEQVSSLRSQVVSLQEDMATLYDPDANLTAAGGGSAYFRRLTQGNRDLNPLQQDKMQQVAAWLYDSNPLAKRVLELVRDFIVGEGVAISSQSKDDEQREAEQEILDAFWEDNELDLRLHDWVLELGAFGESLWTVATNPKDGSVKLGYIDPSAIAEVVTDPTNIERVLRVGLKALGGREAAVLKVVNQIEDPQDEWYGRLQGITEYDGQGKPVETYQPLDSQGKPTGGKKPYAGACMLFRINKFTAARRGRSDLLCLADWVDGLDQVLFNGVDRALLLKSFVWDATLEGMNTQQIADYAKQNPAPKPGSVRYHNEKVKWQAVTPDLKAADDQQAADTLLGHIGSGSGLPKIWLNATLDTNRATAQEMGEPSFKHLTTRQRYVRSMLSRAALFVLDQAEMAGVLDKRENRKRVQRPAPWSVSVQMPELRIKDLKAASETFFQTVQALSVSLAEKLVDVDTAQEVEVLLLSQFGLDVDLAALRERLATAKEEQANVPPIVPSLPPPNGREPEGVEA